MTVKLTGLQEGAVYIVYYRPDLFIRETVEVFSTMQKAKDYIDSLSNPKPYHYEMRYVV